MTVTTDPGAEPWGDVVPETRLRLDDQLCFALCAATNAVVRTYRPLLKALDLTHPQYLLLMALWEDDELKVTDLAARLDLPAHSLSPVLTRLEAAGLVTRRRHATDRRIVTVALTDAGRDLEQHAARAQHEVVLRSHLTKDALEQLRTSLQLLAAQLGAPDSRASAPSSRPS